MPAESVTYLAPCDRCPTLARWSAVNGGAPADVACPVCDLPAPKPLAAALELSRAAWLRRSA